MLTFKDSQKWLTFNSQSKFASLPLLCFFRWRQPGESIPTFLFALLPRPKLSWRRQIRALKRKKKPTQASFVSSSCLFINYGREHLFPSCPRKLLVIIPIPSAGSSNTWRRPSINTKQVPVESEILFVHPTTDHSGTMACQWYGGGKVTLFAHSCCASLWNIPSSKAIIYSYEVTTES